MNFEIKIDRTYHHKGTNGVIFYKEKEVCKCVELPWFDNRPRISCIPEGSYTVFIRETDEYGIHLYIPCVPGRNYILICSLDLQVRELQGCIVPVLKHTGPGMGTGTKEAMQKLMETIYEDIMEVKPVKLIISSNQSTDDFSVPSGSGEGPTNFARQRAVQGGERGKK